MPSDFVEVAVFAQVSEFVNMQAVLAGSEAGYEAAHGNATGSVSL